MSPEIMGAEMNPSQKARFLNPDPGRGIGYGKNPVCGFDSLFPNILL
jgi:hypothetical protein